MSSIASRGAVRIDLLVAVGLTAAVLGLGVYLGSTLFGDREMAAPAPAPPGPVAQGPAESSAPSLRAEPARDLAARVAALEKAFEDFRSGQAKTAEEIRPIVEEYKRLTAGGIPLEGPETPGAPGLPLASEKVKTGDDARKVAQALGLDAARREAMATQYADVLREIEALEKKYAEVTKEGDVTTVRIGKFPDGAADVVGRWRDWVARNLTPQEKEGYERDHSESSLLGVRTGQFARTVRIDETGGVINVTESIETKDGPQEVLQMMAPAAARDLALDGYRHLLPSTGGR